MKIIDNIDVSIIKLHLKMSLLNYQIILFPSLIYLNEFNSSNQSGRNR
jgi:hypothetical protein